MLVLASSILFLRARNNRTLDRGPHRRYLMATILLEVPMLQTKIGHDIAPTPGRRGDVNCFVSDDESGCLTGGGSCPMATMTLKMGVEDLKKTVPGVTEVFQA